MDLLTHANEQCMKSEAILAARLHPRNLDEYVDQEDILSPGKRRCNASHCAHAIDADWLVSSIILWGQPGTGKITSAQVIANTTKSHFETLSAVLAGNAELRDVIERAQERRKLYGTRTTLFVKDVRGSFN
jgi:putative ATPase